MSLRRKSSDELQGCLRSHSAPPSARRVNLVNYITGYEGPVEDDPTFEKLKTQKDTIVLLVDTVRFMLCRKTLLGHPETMLGGMFGENMSRFTQENKAGEYCIDSVTPDIFRAILGYYTEGKIRVPYDGKMYEVKEACDFFLIPFNTATVKSDNLSSLMHEISNDGAKKKFEVFLQKDIVPEMALCAMKGERECHIVCLKDEDSVEWDPEYPPAVGEEQWSMIKNSDINRFLKYIENREIAKVVLQEKGLKKIRLGIEGFPTHKEKVKVKQRGKIQVTYFYVQRPFIVMSWEKEEHRSRHVDFANVSTCQSAQTSGSSADDQVINPSMLQLNAVDEIEQIQRIEVDEQQ